MAWSESNPRHYGQRRECDRMKRSFASRSPWRDLEGARRGCLGEPLAAVSVEAETSWHDLERSGTVGNFRWVDLLPSGSPAFGHDAEAVVRHAGLAFPDDFRDEALEQLGSSGGRYTGRASGPDWRRAVGPRFRKSLPRRKVGNILHRIHLRDLATPCLPSCHGDREEAGSAAYGGVPGRTPRP